MLFPLCLFKKLMKKKFLSNPHKDVIVTVATKPQKQRGKNLPKLLEGN